MKPLESRTIHYEDVTIEVSQASGLQGLRRSRLKMDALQALGSNFDPSNDLHLMRVVSYPDVIGATLRCEGMELPATCEAFLALADALITTWIATTYALNPHWLEFEQTPEEAQKKSLPSSSGSQPRKRHPKPTTTR